MICPAAENLIVSMNFLKRTVYSLKKTVYTLTRTEDAEVLSCSWDDISTKLKNDTTE